MNVSVLPASAAALQPIMPVKVTHQLKGNLLTSPLSKVPIDTSRIILSPMPGVVKSVTVAVGDQVPEIEYFAC